MFSAVFLLAAAGLGGARPEGLLSPPELADWRGDRSWQSPSRSGSPPISGSLWPDGGEPGAPFSSRLTLSFLPGFPWCLLFFFLLLIYFCFIFSSLSFHVSFLSFIFFDLKHHIFFLLRHFRFSAFLIPLPLLPYCVILLLLFSLTLFSATHSLNLSYRVLYSRPLYSPFYCNCRYRVLSLPVVAKSSASGF